MISVWLYVLLALPQPTLNWTSDAADGPVSKLARMVKEGQEMAYIDTDGELHVSDGVTAEEALGACFEYAQDMNAMKERIHRIIRRFKRVSK